MQKQLIKFSKMHGIGNDFVIVDDIKQLIDEKNLPIAELANRHTGIGFDQLLVLKPSSRAAVFCRIYNADGSEAEQCGNGLRCVARYLHEQRIFSNKSLNIQTSAGIFAATIANYQQISIEMGKPQIEKLQQSLTINTEIVTASILSFGNPHAIIKVETVDTVPVDQFGKMISTHKLFTDGINVGFMQIVNKTHIRLRTYERGVGETFACGSNACAAVVSGIMNGWLQNSVKVEFKNGYLSVEWNGEGDTLRMSGPAEKVFMGEVWV